MKKIIQKSSGLKRPRHPMPDFVKRALEEHCLMADFQARPAYQQNDYNGRMHLIRWADTLLSSNAKRWAA